jgi:hypothetical protein
MRRGGMWRGKRLLSQRYMRESLAPTPTNGCYGWLIWLNKGAPCVGPTISERPVDNEREFPDLPADLYRFSGLFGQLVTVFPEQDIEIVRLGQDGGLVFSGGTDWEHELYRRVLASLRDGSFKGPPPPAQPTGPEQKSADYGFQTALQHPDQYREGAVQSPLPPAGPARARAARLRLAHPSVSRKGIVTVRMTCPARWPGRDPAPCRGTASLQSVAKALRYDVPPGTTTIFRYRLSAKQLRALRRAGAMSLEAIAVNTDALAGTRAAVGLRVRKPTR